ncbi:MAG: AbrB/MazE/SpoVT family DNA-binding domain-containing protein [Candidatus Promineifilaceae bacterium]|nr:AbrB/MazE/SpoVT family DNA-binding domain-containing protein [Candidatus Promineifilaceae bacterium]
MAVKLSSKGQLVIPKEIRRALDLRPGTEFEIELDDRQIILRPIMDKEKLKQIIAELRALAGGTDWLGELEAERRWELDREHRRE